MHSYLYNVCKIFREVYIPGKLEVERLRDSGCGNVHWCPEAYSSDIHTLNDYKGRFGLSFIGQQDNVIRTHCGLTRREMLVKLYERYGDDFLVARGFYGEAYTEIMNSRKLCIDIPISNNIGTRMFESSAMGVPVVREKNNVAGMDNFFKKDYNYFEFENIYDMYEQIDYILSMPDNEYYNLCMKVAESMEHQSYDHRIARVLGVLDDI